MLASEQRIGVNLTVAPFCSLNWLALSLILGFALVAVCEVERMQPFIHFVGGGQFWLRCN